MMADHRTLGSCQWAYYLRHEFHGGATRSRGSKIGQKGARHSVLQCPGGPGGPGLATDQGAPATAGSSCHESCWSPGRAQLQAPGTRSLRAAGNPGTGPGIWGLLA
jgi:hypothetical protein